MPKQFPASKSRAEQYCPRPLFLPEYHYKRVGRPFRFCHPLDLLNQARDFCEFHRRPLFFSRDVAELAVLNYFSGMAGQLTI